MSIESGSARKIIESPNETGEVLDVKEKFALPTGFVTEKGSRYTYSDDGRVNRHKFDGTDHSQGIAVFVPYEQKGLDILERYFGAESDHIPASGRFKPYIVQLSRLDETKEVTIDRIYKTQDVTDPSNLFLSSETQDGSKRASGVRVSLSPQIGSMVYEMDRLEGNRTNRHPGHRVTEIID